MDTILHEWRTALRPLDDLEPLPGAQDRLDRLEAAVVAFRRHLQETAGRGLVVIAFGGQLKEGKG